MSETLGVIGFIMSAVLTVLKIAEFCRDRARVSLALEFFVGRAGVVARLSVTNNGRRSLTIVKAGIAAPKETIREGPHDRLTILLEESEQKSMEWVIHAQDFKKLSRFVKAEITTSSGKTYRKSHRLSESEWDELKKAAAEEANRLLSQAIKNAAKQLDR